MAVRSIPRALSALAGAVIAASAVFATPALAWKGHGDGVRVFFSFGFFGQPYGYYAPYPYYAPAYVYPPYYDDDPYYGDPVGAYPYEPVAPARSYDRSYCREFQSTVVIGGRLQPAYGTACLQPDGSWMIVPE